MGSVVAVGLGNLCTVRHLLVQERCTARETPGVLAALAQTSQRWRDVLASVVLPLEAQLTLLQYRRSASPVPSNITFAVWRLAPSSPSHIVAPPLVSRHGAARLPNFKACTAGAMRSHLWCCRSKRNLV